MAGSQRVTLTQTRTRRRIGVTVDGDRPHVVGSDPGCDTTIDDTAVDPRHAELRWSEDRLWVAPLGAGVVTVNGHPLSAATALADGDWLALGTVLHQISFGGDAPVEQTKTVPYTVGQDVQAPAAPKQELTVGRLAESDVRIDSPAVSRRHARLIREAEGTVLEDLGSVNGTFVNGRRITKRRLLRGGERLEFGSFAYLFDGEGLVELEGAGSIRVDVRSLELIVKDISTGAPKSLLQDINLSFLPGEFVVVFGTSGSGKSTLVDALNGRRRATGGTVAYNETELYGSFDLFRSTIGYVPQQDIVHRGITVRQALGYAARLRLPPDTSAAEIDEHVIRVLDRVGLSDKIDQPIDTPSPLSGGQLKRVSVAVELVSNPSILFLDEATSGLDAGTDRKLMGLFAELARDNKTVVCVTHTLESIDACDLVVLLHQGRLVYFGPPGDALEHFGIQRLSHVYETLESKPAEYWAKHYENSKLHRTYVAERLGPAPSAEEEPPESSETSRLPMLDLRQTTILLQRYVALMLSDSRSLLMSLLPAPAIGLLIGYVWAGEGTVLERAPAYSQVCFTFVLSAIWLGCLNASREIVKELPVYLRERAVNIGLLPYVTSKLGPMTLMCVVQSVSMLGAAALLIDLPGSFAERAAVLSVSATAAAAMGLAVSSMVDTTDKAIATVPLLLVPQLIFSNVFPLPSTAQWIGKVSMVSFWGYDAMKATLGDAVLASVEPYSGKSLVSLEGGIGGDIAIITLLAAVFTAAIFVGLRMKDRQL